MNVLVVRFGPIGDLLRTTLLFRALKASFPNGKTVWATDASALGGILDGHPDIDLRLDFPRRWGALGEAAVFLKKLRAERFDAVLDLQGTFRTAAIVGAARALRKIGFDEWNEGAKLFYGETVARRGLRWWGESQKMVEKIGGTWKFDWKLPLPAPSREFSGRFFAEGMPKNAPAIFIFPGSRPSRRHGLRRRWETENFIALGKRLRAKIGASLLVGHGIGEEGMARAIVEGVGEGAVLAPAASIADVGALVARSRLYIGNDTGPTHLAWLLRVPTVFVTLVPTHQTPPEEAGLSVAEVTLADANIPREEAVRRVQDAALALWERSERVA